jgi:hypothetical protein
MAMRPQETWLTHPREEEGAAREEAALTSPEVDEEITVEEEVIEEVIEEAEEMTEEAEVAEEDTKLLLSSRETLRSMKLLLNSSNLLPHSNNSPLLRSPRSLTTRRNPRQPSQWKRNPRAYPSPNTRKR